MIRVIHGLSLYQVALNAVRGNLVTGGDHENLRESQLFEGRLG